MACPSVFYIVFVSFNYVTNYHPFLLSYTNSILAVFKNRLNILIVDLLVLVGARSNMHESQQDHAPPFTKFTGSQHHVLSSIT